MFEQRSDHGPDPIEIRWGNQIFEDDVAVAVERGQIRLDAPGPTVPLLAVAR
ncbi:hypothetical protein [Nocardia sp. NPDC059228]|uniref:hypothetical protein n=1 Tax=Nocardia sp. NPDC059228 TaxID=3346777 RepID=UPI0036CCD90A